MLFVHHIDSDAVKAINASELQRSCFQWNECEVLLQPHLRLTTTNIEMVMLDRFSLSRAMMSNGTVEAMVVHTAVTVACS